MRAAVTIALKDLRQRLRDRSALLIALVVPLALAGILNLTIGQAASGDISFTFAVADEDGGQLSASFRRNVLAPLEADGLIALRDAASADEARAWAETGTIDAAFVLPAGFTDAVTGGGGAGITVIGNIDAPIGTQVAASIAGAFAERLHAVQLATAAMLAASGGSGGAAGVDLAAVAARAAAVPPPAVLEDASASRRELDFTTFYAAGMAVFFLLFTVQFGLSSLVDERRDATLLRLLAAPIPRGSILGGKVLTSLVLGTASMVTLFVASSLLLGARWGAPAGVAILIVAGVLAATGITAVTATLARTAEQGGSFQSIVAVVLGMLGGTFFPVEQAGGVLASVTRVTPHFWFMRGLADAQVGVANVLPAAAALLVIAVATSAVAALRMNRLARP